MATTVTVGGTAATNITVASATSLTATVPAGTVGAADVVVTTSAGSATKTGAFTYTAPAVTLASFAPNVIVAPVAADTSVVATGTNITATTIVVGASTTTELYATTARTATTLTFTVPSGTAASSFNVRLYDTATGRASTGVPLGLLVTPTVTALNPASMVAGATSLTVTGTGFASGGNHNSQVVLDDVPVGVAGKSPNGTSIDLFNPFSLTPGTYNIKVRNVLGSGQVVSTTSQTLTVTAP